jgi:hypothetical protein
MDPEWQHFMDRIIVRLKHPERNMKAIQENIMAGQKNLNTKITSAIWSTQDDVGFRNELQRTRWKQKTQVTEGDSQVGHRGTGNTAT